MSSRRLKWNQTEAAKILKINRNTLIQKARQFGILLKERTCEIALIPIHCPQSCAVRIPPFKSISFMSLSTAF